MSTVRVTLAWTEKAMAAHRARDGALAQIPDNDPFEGPVIEADAATSLALARAGVLARLDRLPHEGMSLDDEHEEGWFDLDQLDGLIAALEAMLAEPRAGADAERVSRWLAETLAFARKAKLAMRGVCIWV